MANEIKLWRLDKNKHYLGKNNAYENQSLQSVLQLFIAKVAVQVFGNPFAYHSVTTHDLSLKSACPVMQEIQYLCGLAVLYNPRQRL